MSACWKCGGAGVIGVDHIKPCPCCDQMSASATSARAVLAIGCAVGAVGASLRACGWAARAAGCVVVGGVAAMGWALERAGVRAERGA